MSAVFSPSRLVTLLGFFTLILSASGLFARLSLSMPDPKFSQLTREDAERLDRQRALVAAAAKQRYGVSSLTKTSNDLPILQRLIDDRVFQKSQTYELQSLGVVFGDVLASELPLRWAIITDEYGRDPTLRYKNTNVNINALTMISKRIENGEPVKVLELLRQTREVLADIEKPVH
jgi:hypothetical protein